jgi:hypothetical protein
MTSATTAYGSKFEVETAAGSGTFKEIGEVVKITPPKPVRDTAEATHMKSPGATKEYIATLIEPGDMSVELNFVPASSSDTFLLAWVAGGDTRQARVTYPSGSSNDAFPAIGLSYAAGDLTPEDKMSGTLDVKVAGQVVPTRA